MQNGDVHHGTFKVKTGLAAMQKGKYYGELVLSYSIIGTIGIQSTLSSREVLGTDQASYDFCLAPWPKNTFYDVESGRLCLGSK